MNVRIKPLGGGRLRADRPVSIPSSKSHTIRALLIAALAEGESRLENPLDSADARSCIDACRALGAEIDTGAEPGLWRVRGNGGRFPERIPSIDVGNSGTTLYLAAAVSALAGSPAAFTGDEQIRRRPAAALLQSLADLGADVDIRGEGGSAPFSVCGPLRGGRTSIECPTSQYLSALLMSCPLADGESVIEVPLLMEKPYVEMTLRWLSQQGISLSRNEAMSRFVIPGGQRYIAFDGAIPGDFSSAAFPLCAAAVTGSSLRLSGLDVTDSQGDKAVIDYLGKMGCRFECGTDSVEIDAPPRLSAGRFDLNATPDALPAMAVAACFAEGESDLGNVPQARLKETDRISVMRQELSKMGADISEKEDGLLIRGGRPLQGAMLDGHGDHRVVMSLSVAALKAGGECVISGAEAVDITYPGFFGELEKLGAEVELF